MKKDYFIYFLSSNNNQALYIGITSDLQKRLYEHKNNIKDGFSKKYNCKKLVYLEHYTDAKTAISREKQLKRWIRGKKNTLINKENPEWKDLSIQYGADPSTTGLRPSAQDDIKMERYQRQLNLPEINPVQQQKLQNTRLLMVGAGGLGAPALPYLAASGIGHITILDHDTVDISNLHRQTIFKNSEAGQPKADLTAAYLHALNPDITVISIAEKLTPENIYLCEGFDIILDGSDNFKTKTLLNDIALKTGTPLISASVNQFEGQVGIFAGHIEGAPCYHCLFSQLPENARNCNEAGILGTSAGITGLYQAHLTLMSLLGIGNIAEGSILSLNLKSMRMRLLKLAKDPACAVCSKIKHQPKPKALRMTDIPLVARTDLQTKDHIVIDVREDYELDMDPIDNVIHIPLGQLPMRTNELPQDKTLAFVCASNVRSRKAAEYFASLGFKDVCVLDKKTT